jgi:hypothetical protein
MEELWNNPLFIGTRFTQEAKKIGFSLKEIKEFVAKQEAYQQTKQKGGTIDYFPILRPPGSFQMDLMFLDNPRNKTKQLPILCFIDTNTRYAYTYLLKNKTADEVLRATNDFLYDSKGKCQFVQSDNGSEFINKKIEQLFTEHGVSHSTVEPGDHRGQGAVERFNKTLKGLVLLIVNQGFDWTKFLPQITENYNHRVHSAIGVAPVDATENEGRYVRYLQYLDARKRLLEFKPGDQVRKELFRHALEKGGLRWSKQVFTVKAIEGNHVVLDDDTNWQYYNLQKISGVEKAAGPSDEERQQVRVEKKKERDFRAEGIERAEAFDGSVYVGRKIRKKFGNRWFTGKVEKYDLPRRGDPKGFNWLIRYPDGDSETMDFKELQAHLVTR